jgi:pimeloyl-ACP methyl ester carboxylesterase
MQPIYEFGGAGPILHMAVANGFPPEVYKPLVWPMTGQYLAVSLPPRAMWPGENPPQTLQSWRDTVAVDLLEGLKTYDLRDVIAIGHSFGGVATILAAAAQPHRFKALVLLDPTILPQPAYWLYQLNTLLSKTGRLGRNPLAERRKTPRPL